MQPVWTNPLAGKSAVVRTDFTTTGVTLELEPSEYSFIFRCINDRLATLEDWEIEVRLAMEAPAAQVLLQRLLDSELAARDSGDHWLPPRT